MSAKSIFEYIWKDAEMKSKRITIIFLVLLCCSLVLTGCKDTKTEKAAAEAARVEAAAEVKAAAEKAAEAKAAAEKIEVTTP